MYIQSEVRELQDGSRLIEYSGRAGIQEKYIFPETQSTINFHNEGNKPITLTINGITYTVTGGEKKNITKNIKDFTVSASEKVPFTVRGWEAKNVKGFRAKKPIQVATRCTVYHEGTTMTGTVAGTTYRYEHKMRTACHNLQLVFGNHYPTSTSESSNANAITIQVAIEWNGQTTRLHFNGEAQKTIGQGGMAITDPILRDIPEGSTFYTRTWVSVATDGVDTVPQHLLLDAAADGKAIGNVVTSTGGMTAASTERGYGPSAIIGIPDRDDAIAFGLYGDSIVTSPSSIGWPINLVEPDYGYIIASRPTATAAGLETSSGNVYRLRYVQFCTHVIMNFGTNDFNGAESYSAVIARFQDLWERIKSAGAEVYHSTTLPRTSSTDSWATTGNQTPVSANSYNTKRANFNASLRNGEFPVRVLDIAAAAETASASSGVWKAAYTADGIHPNTTSRDAMVAAADLGLY